MPAGSLAGHCEFEWCMWLHIAEKCQAGQGLGMGAAGPSTMPCCLGMSTAAALQSFSPLKLVPLICCPNRTQASELASTRQQLMELVERMFSSPAWRASPRQTELVEALQALEAQSAEVVWQQQQPVEWCCHTLLGCTFWRF